MKTESQVTKIYRYLKMRNKLTGLKALRLFGTMCLPKRISEVQKFYGVNVSREMISVKSAHGVKHVMEYKLTTNGKNK